MKEQLEQTRAWAQKKIATGQEPPWAWYQYMKLIETLDAILAAMEATKTADSPQADRRQETSLRLVGSTDPQEKPPHHSVEIPTQLPM